MLSTYRYARGRRGWLEAPGGGRGRTTNSFLEGTRAPPAPQDTGALSTELTRLCPEEVTSVRSPMRAILAHDTEAEGPGSHSKGQANKNEWWTESKQDWP